MSWRLPRRPGGPAFRDEHGVVTTEFAFGAGVLILPVALLVLSIPVWVERQSTARVAAQEAAREAVLATTPAAATAAGRGVVEEVASNLGLDAGDLAVCFSVHAIDESPEGCSEAVPALPRGAAVTARVSVGLPLLSFPLLGSALETTSYSASHTERVDEYRSFEP